MTLVAFGCVVPFALGMFSLLLALFGRTNRDYVALLATVETEPLSVATNRLGMVGISAGFAVLHFHDRHLLGYGLGCDLHGNSRFDQHIAAVGDGR